MNDDNPFKKLQSTVPIIGSPTIFGAVVCVHFACICDGKQPIQAVAGQIAACPACKRHWQVNAGVNVQLNQVSVATES